MNPLLLLLFFLCCLQPASAVLSYPGCTDLTKDDFVVEVLQSKRGGPDQSIHEPIQMDFEAALKADGNMTAYVYYIERRGRVKLFDPFKKTVATIGSPQTTSRQDNGLLGIALDPHFAHSRWMYLFYSEKEDPRMRLSRFTLRPDRSLDSASEKVILTIPCKERKYPTPYHVGGPMAFDGYGDLWIAVGNNSPSYGSHIDEESEYNSDEGTASNTADLRGSILRIHPLRFSDSENPLPGIGRTYTIPEGNFGPYYAAWFRQKGRNELADEYADTSLVKPEIYTKGHRSNFSITVHPVTRRMAWGEANPGASDDEFNLVRNPVFSGYPYFMGNNTPTSGHTLLPEAPRNMSRWNTGVKELPPVPLPADGGYNKGGGASAMAGPIYLYDGSLKSDVKLPPHLNGHWIVGEYVKSWVRVYELAADDGNITTMHDIFPQYDFHRPLDLHIGPDGALYVLNYDGYYSSGANTGLVKVAYKGACRPASPPAPRTGCKDPRFDSYSAHYAGHDSAACLFPTRTEPIPESPNRLIYPAGRNTVRVGYNGPLETEFFDLQGRLLSYQSCQGPCEIPMPQIPGARLCLIRVKTAAGDTEKLLLPLMGNR